MLAVLPRGIEPEGKFKPVLESITVTIPVDVARDSESGTPVGKGHVDLGRRLLQETAKDLSGAERRNTDPIMPVEGMDDLVGDERLGVCVGMKIVGELSGQPDEVEITRAGSRVRRTCGLRRGLIQVMR